MANICTERRANAAGCGAILLWSGLALLSRLAADVPPVQLTAMAFAVSGAGGLLILAWRRRLDVLRLPVRAWMHGVGGLFVFHALYFASLALAPPAAANLLNYTWPLLVVLLSAPVLGLRLGARHLAGVLLAGGGCALLLTRGGTIGGGAALGYVCAAAASVTWAGYSVLSRRLAQVPSAAVAGFCAGAAVLAVGLHLLTEPTVWPGAAGWAAVLVLGVGPVGAAFALWDLGMKRGDPRLLGTLAFATPVLSTLLLISGGLAPLTAATLGAAALVAVGGWVASRPGRGLPAVAGRS